MKYSPPLVERTTSNAKHYQTLDAARGIAAIAVMLYHVQRYIFPDVKIDSAPHFLQHSYLAVDLFFLMSGLVVARAYEAKMLSGNMGFREFFIVRLIRLSPLYFLGTIGGFIFGLISILTAGNQFYPTSIIILLLNLLYIPHFMTRHHSIFTYDPAAWSLSLEIWINLAYAAMARHLRTWALGIICTISGAALIWTTIEHGSVDMGSGIETFFIGGALRICFSFTLGIIIYRLIARGALQAPTLPPSLLLTALALLILTPLWPSSVAYELFCVMVAFPTFATLGCFTQKSPIDPLYSWLGLISYAVYILHNPVMSMVEGIWGYFMHEDLAASTMLTAPILLISIFAISYLTVIYFDEPVRKFLTKTYIKKNDLLRTKAL